MGSLDSDKNLESSSNLDDSIEILKESSNASIDLVCQNICVKIKWRHQIHRIDTKKV